jgi:hypothetical protein
MRPHHEGALTASGSGVYFTAQSRTLREVAMPRWLRMIRGMIGTGLAFAVGGGAIGTLVGIPFVLSGKMPALDLVMIAGRFGVAGFLVGVVFSGALALLARGRTLEKLSLSRVAALGAGVGLLYFAFIATNGIGVWTVPIALLNFASLAILGGGSAAAVLLLARRATSALGPHDEPRALGEGSVEPHARAMRDDLRAAEPVIRR